MSAVNKIIEFFTEYEKNNAFNSCIISFSGGHDSLALLDILKDTLINKKIIALHINHNWRGQESLQEENNCREYCLKNSIQFTVKTLDKNLPHNENTAREERYKFFVQIAKEYSAQVVFTAHTKSDTVETTLYNLAKGSGLNGVTGIPAIREIENIKIVRPMLNISRKEIDEYLKEKNLKPNEDSSNTNTKYKRNLIRNKIIPQLKEINPEVENAISNFNEIVQNGIEILDELITEKKEQVEKNGKFNNSLFTQLSRPIQSKLIYDYIIQNGEEPTKLKVDKILKYITDSQNLKTGKILSFSKELSFFVNNEVFHFIKNKTENKNFSVEINNIGEFKTIFGLFSIKEENAIPEKFPNETAFCAITNIPKEIFPLTLRNRQDGDIIQPFGMIGSMKLKKYFINKNIPKYARDDIILLCKENEVLWAVGIGLSEKLRVLDKKIYKMELKNG